MTVTALASPVTAEAFVIASEPHEPAAVGTSRLRAALRAAPNRLICTPCGDGAREEAQIFGDPACSEVRVLCRRG
jgi:hypothetical protein